MMVSLGFKGAVLKDLKAPLISQLAEEGRRIRKLGLTLC